MPSLPDLLGIWLTYHFPCQHSSSSAGLIPDLTQTHLLCGICFQRFGEEPHIGVMDRCSKAFGSTVYNKIYIYCSGKIVPKKFVTSWWWWPTWLNIMENVIKWNESSVWRCFTSLSRSACVLAAGFFNSIIIFFFLHGLLFWLEVFMASCWGVASHHTLHEGSVVCCGQVNTLLFTERRRYVSWPV